MSTQMIPHKGVDRHGVPILRQPYEPEPELTECPLCDGAPEYWDGCGYVPCQLAAQLPHLHRGEPVTVTDKYAASLIDDRRQDEYIPVMRIYAPGWNIVCEFEFLGLDTTPEMVRDIILKALNGGAK